MTDEEYLEALNKGFKFQLEVERRVKTCLDEIVDDAVAQDIKLAIHIIISTLLTAAADYATVHSFPDEDMVETLQGILKIRKKLFMPEETPTKPKEEMN